MRIGCPWELHLSWEAGLSVRGRVPCTLLAVGAVFFVLSVWKISQKQELACRIQVLPWERRLRRGPAVAGMEEEPRTSRHLERKTISKHSPWGSHGRVLRF